MKTQMLGNPVRDRAFAGCSRAVNGNYWNSVHMHR
jgi:hypothetical protein